MIKKNLKTLILGSIAILIPILVGVILWDRMPQEIPIHWNMAGEVDRWSDKRFAVFGMPFILLAIHWFGALAMTADPKRQNQSDKMVSLSLWIVPVVSILLTSVTYVSAIGVDVLINVIVPVFLGLVFVVIGNYLPKCKQNYTVGIKLPWTLNNEENWNKTHRMAGWVWVICGIVIVVTGCFGLLWVILPILAIGALAPAVYSYILHRKGL